MSACNPISSAATNATIAMNAGVEGAYPGALTPDALMIYLQTRLESLDGQISQIFEQQQKFDKLRSLLGKITSELNKLNDKADPNELQGTVHGIDGQTPEQFQQEVQRKVGEYTKNMDFDGLTAYLKNLPNTVPNKGVDDPAGAQGYEANIESLLNQVAELDPQLAAQMRTDMRKEGQILCCEDGLYQSGEVSASKDYIDNLMKDAEASAQLNMIRLQSTMSSRQTAIQLSTNLVASLGESSKAIVSNCRV